MRIWGPRALKKLGQRLEEVRTSVCSLTSGLHRGFIFSIFQLLVESQVLILTQLFSWKTGIEGDTEICKFSRRNIKMIMVKQTRIVRRGALVYAPILNCTKYRIQVCRGKQKVAGNWQFAADGEESGAKGFLCSQALSHTSVGIPNIIGARLVWLHLGGPIHLSIPRYDPWHFALIFLPLSSFTISPTHSYSAQDSNRPFCPFIHQSQLCLPTSLRPFYSLDRCQNVSNVKHFY